MASLCTNFCPENIPIAIQKFRSGNEEPKFMSNTLEEPLSGGQCRIYKLGFSDKTSWAVRIPTNLRFDSEEEVRTLLETEIAVLKWLKQCEFPWSPKLLGYCLTFDNPVGFPFLVLTWIPGNPLVWTTSTPAKRADRDKVVSQMAKMMISLISCTQRGNGGSALKYFTNKIDQKIIRICQGRLREISVTHCFYLRNLLQKAIHPELDDSPFFIEHGDLSPQNIIVDSEYNIMGIIDWGFSSYQPFQLAASLPRFLAIEGSFDLASYLVVQNDRSMFLEALKAESLNSPTIVPLLVELYSAPDVDYRRLILDAIVSKGRHKWFADKPWFSSDSGSMVDVAREVNEFFARKSGQISGLDVSKLLELTN